ncbi:hypothetical protein, partial [Vibrio sagamiensis]|uniref:hypothetical protein n=1 Tax=Vibrio sagamiensis TaxID=512650 RepID=UPI001C9913DA
KVAGKAIGSVKKPLSNARGKMDFDRTLGRNFFNVKSYSSHKDGMSTFIDTYKGNNRLNISGHGNSPSFLFSGKVLVDGVNFKRAKDVLPLLKNEYDFDNIASIRVLTCYSGDHPSYSFAAELHQLTQLPVKGFKGKIHAADPSAFARAIQLRGNIINKNGKHKYDPIWFGIRVI